LYNRVKSLLENKIDIEILEELVSNSNIGIALYKWEELTPEYENEQFIEWLPKKKGDTELTQRIPTLKIERLKKKLEKGSSYNIDYEIKKNNRSKIIKLHFSQTKSSSIFIKATDYTKEKELEYMLDSYIKMAEDNSHRLEESIEVIKNQKKELLKAYNDLERERNSIELRALQAVINPHFVSNCLASIQRFILDNDTEPSVNYLSHFGQLMRMNFEQSYSDYVSLNEIFRILETYVSIEKIRIDHPWEFSLNADNIIDAENIKIPPLLIQPFLENAIWHGINEKKVGGIIRIDFDQIDEITLKCTIEDNGLGRKKNDVNKKKRKDTLHSLNVTGKRLDILWAEYEQKRKITYTDLETAEGLGCGTRVELYIPINF